MAMEYKIQNQNGQITILNQNVSFWTNETTLSSTFNISVSVSIDRNTGEVSIQTPLQDDINVGTIKTVLEAAIVELNNVL